MKTGKTYTTLIMVVIAAAVSIYFGVYAFNTFNDPYTTTYAYSYTINDSAELSGVLVREETVLPAQAGILDLVMTEGAKVAAGQTVALVYQDARAQADQGELERLAREIALLESAVRHSDSAENSPRLDEEILQSVVELRAACALGDYSRLEEQVMTVKSSVLQRGYTYADGISAADLTAQLRQLRQEYAQLNCQTDDVVTKVSAPCSGTFSCLADGYEALLTPQTLFSLTPGALRTLMESPHTVQTNIPGKLIHGFTWYYAAVLPADTAARLIEGRTARLQFTGDFSRDMEMTVAHVGEKQEGECLVVFSSDRYLSEITLLRRQQAELIFEDHTGLRIPKEALRMEKSQREDPESGQITTETQLGVYALVGGRVEFKGVQVLADGADYYVVRPTDTGRKILRAGDEIILQGTGLYAGQLLEY